ncbi:MAG: mechanosensitive ion channel family protein [Bacteroidetes bacterium]|nr:MAG: mechanosensitive ion channel family protein [Bacteroidota bacterium]
MDTKLVEWLISNGFSESFAIFTKTIIFGVSLLIISYLSYLIAKKIITRLIHKVLLKTKFTWDDAFVEQKVFVKLAHIVPAIIILAFINLVFKDYEKWGSFVTKASYFYIVIVVMLVINSVILSFNSIYNMQPISKTRHIKGYVQMVQILVAFIGIMMLFSILSNKDLSKLFFGLGTFAAVLMLVFKDTILGFVASIQVSMNNMVNIGDWISMPGRNADGVVLEINLNTVKVQNWDKTISSIPTYALVSESFQNWRGMEESGGRRIKRSINIDMTSTKFCSTAMIKKFNKIQLLSDYIQHMEKEITEYNESHKIDPSILVNGRRMTNLGTFRKYIKEYLKVHPLIHDNMTFLVRQLQPNEKGIPIEIYVFSKDQEWANYEAIQADIFDHILAVLPEFELRVFQNPTGHDFLVLNRD